MSSTPPPGSRRCVWIGLVGPARGGKTALLRRLSEGTYRPEAVAAEEEEEHQQLGPAQQQQQRQGQQHGTYMVQAEIELGREVITVNVVDICVSEKGGQQLAWEECARVAATRCAGFIVVLPLRGGGGGGDGSGTGSSSSLAQAEQWLGWLWRNASAAPVVLAGTMADAVGGGDAGARATPSVEELSALAGRYGADYCETSALLQCTRDGRVSAVVHLFEHALRLVAASTSLHVPAAMNAVARLKRDHDIAQRRQWEQQRLQSGSGGDCDTWLHQGYLERKKTAGWGWSRKWFAFAHPSGPLRRYRSPEAAAAAAAAGAAGSSQWTAAALEGAGRGAKDIGLSTLRGVEPRGERGLVLHRGPVMAPQPAGGQTERRGDAAMGPAKPPPPPLLLRADTRPEMLSWLWAFQWALDPVTRGGGSFSDSGAASNQVAGGAASPYGLTGFASWSVDRRRHRGSRTLWSNSDAAVFNSAPHLRYSAAAAAVAAAGAPPLAPEGLAAHWEPDGDGGATLHASWHPARGGQPPRSYVARTRYRPAANAGSGSGSTSSNWVNWTARGRHRALREIAVPPRSPGPGLMMDAASAPQTSGTARHGSEPHLGFRATGLEGACEYSVEVLARGEAGAGPWCRPVLLRVPVLPPGAPAPPQLQPDTQATLRVRWTGPRRDGGAPLQAFRLQLRQCGEVVGADGGDGAVAASPSMGEWRAWLLPTEVLLARNGQGEGVGGGLYWQWAGPGCLEHGRSYQARVCARNDCEGSDNGGGWQWGSWSAPSQPCKVVHAASVNVVYEGGLRYCTSSSSSPLPSSISSRKHAAASMPRGRAAACDDERLPARTPRRTHSRRAVVDLIRSRSSAERAAGERAALAQAQENAELSIIGRELRATQLQIAAELDSQLSTTPHAAAQLALGMQRYQHQGETQRAPLQELEDSPLDTAEVSLRRHSPVPSPIEVVVQEQLVHAKVTSAPTSALIWWSTELALPPVEIPARRIRAVHAGPGLCEFSVEEQQLQEEETAASGHGSYHAQKDWRTAPIVHCFCASTSAAAQCWLAALGALQQQSNGSLPLGPDGRRLVAGGTEIEADTARMLADLWVGEAAHATDEEEWAPLTSDDVSYVLFAGRSWDPAMDDNYDESYEEEEDEEEEEADRSLSQRWRRLGQGHLLGNSWPRLDGAARPTDTSTATEDGSEEARRQWLRAIVSRGAETAGLGARAGASVWIAGLRSYARLAREVAALARTDAPTPLQLATRAAELALEPVELTKLLQQGIASKGGSAHGAQLQVELRARVHAGVHTEMLWHGWLKKSGGSAGSKWRTRWFELSTPSWPTQAADGQECQLRYYEKRAEQSSSEKARTFKGAMFLQGASVMPWVSSVEDAQKFQIRLMGSHSRSGNPEDVRPRQLFLSAASDDERQKWLAALAVAIEAVNPPGGVDLMDPADESLNSSVSLALSPTVSSSSEREARFQVIVYRAGRAQLPALRCTARTTVRQVLRALRRGRQLTDPSLGTAAPRQSGGGGEMMEEPEAALVLQRRGLAEALSEETCLLDYLFVREALAAGCTAVELSVMPAGLSLLGHQSSSRWTEDKTTREEDLADSLAELSWLRALSQSVNERTAADDQSPRRNSKQGLGERRSDSGDSSQDSVRSTRTGSASSDGDACLDGSDNLGHLTAAQRSRVWRARARHLASGDAAYIAMVLQAVPDWSAPQPVGEALWLLRQHWDGGVFRGSTRQGSGSRHASPPAAALRPEFALQLLDRRFWAAVAQPAEESGGGGGESALPTNVDVSAAGRIWAASAPFRRFGVECLAMTLRSDEELSLYLLELAQLLKREPLPNPATAPGSGLGVWLLYRALRTPFSVGQTLFWHLRAEMLPLDSDDAGGRHSADVVSPTLIFVRLGLLLRSFIEECGARCAGGLRRQELLSAVLQHTVTAAKARAQLPKTEQREALQAELQERLDSGEFPFVGGHMAIRLPVDGSMAVVGLDVEGCRVFGSAQKPLLLPFVGADPSAAAQQKRHVVIFKGGDDVRQDMLCLQNFNIMRALWREAGYDIPMTPRGRAYGCVALGPEMGMLECVRGAHTLADIAKWGEVRACCSSPTGEGGKVSGGARAHSCHVNGLSQLRAPRARLPSVGLSTTRHCGE
eukprot:COSAG01_NODE_538_length_15761_cov_8.160388_1_plen_2130_part_00